MENHKKAAFFDLDNTLISGSSSFYFIKDFMSDGSLKFRNLIKMGLDHIKFVHNKTEDSQAMANAITQLLHFARDKRQSDILDRCNDLARKLIQIKAFPKMLHRIKEHQSAGHDTWIVSAAPKEITSQIALHLKMTGAFGTVGEVKNGRYTGKLESEPMHGPAKAQTVKKLAATRNYQLGECFAYSDSVNDLPLLASVGYPVVVNANKQLLTIAQKNSWKILRDLK